jgi:spore germination protein YaaH
MDKVIRIGSLILLGIALLMAAGIVISYGRSNDPVANDPVPVPTNNHAPEETPSITTNLTNTHTINSHNPEVVHPKSGRYVAAWMPTEWDTDNARASFEANLDYIDEVSPVWYDMRSNGTLRALGGSRDETLIETAHAAGVLVLPSITNGFDPDRTGYTLRDPDRRSRFVQRIVDEVEEYDYDGVDIDFESMYSSEREVFTAFIRELAAALHNNGKILAIAVHARSSAEGGAGGAQAQDWEAIGQVVDRFRIMTYDYHWRGGGAGPVSPIYWVEDVIEYAKTQVDPAKIQVGIPFYGYDWVGMDGSGVTWELIQELIEIHEPEVHLQEWGEQGEVAEAWFNYRDREGWHEVWFSSPRSMEAKLDLIAEYDLAGMAIWRLGGENPAYWHTIRETLTRDPYEVLRSIVRYLPDP